MKKAKALLLSVTLLAAFTGAIYFWNSSNKKPQQQLYELEMPVKKSIKQEISATGTLKLKDQIKVGSLISGCIAAIYVEENAHVKAGEKLILIDTGFGDMEVREAEGAYERAVAELQYQELHYQKKKKLFDEYFLSEIEFEAAKRDYRTTLADVKALKATYEKKKNAYQSTTIYAPTSGIVIRINAIHGAHTSSNSDDKSLLTIAPDMTLVEAELKICQRDIGQLQKGQTVKLSVDTYPNRIFESTIHTISWTPIDEDEKECLYRATAYVDNPHLHLRPGMSINANIAVAEAEEVWTVTSRSFLINENHLRPICEMLSFTLEPIDAEEKQMHLAMQGDSHQQFVWTLNGHCVKEMPVEVGVTDHLAFEIRSGLQGNEKLIVDIVEEDQMQEFYKKFTGKL